MCPDCGTDPSLWTVSDEGVAAVPYSAQVFQCGSCAAVEFLAKQVRNDPAMQDANGVKYRVVPFTPPATAQAATDG